MKSYSAAARSFLFLVWMLGLAVVLAALLLPPSRGERFAPMQVGFAIVLAIVAGTRKVHLLRSKRPDESRYVTMGFLVTFGTLLALGIRAGVLVGIVSAVIADLYPRRNVRHQMLFNACSVAVTAWCSGQVFAWINGGVGTIGASSWLAVLAAITVYFLLNAGMLALIIALLQQQPVTAVLRKNFLWAYPLHLTGAAYIALAIMFINDSRMILLGASVVPFALQYYKMYADHVAQKQRLIDKLEAGKEELSELYLSTVKSLATAIAAKDQYTHAHIHRVQHYAVAIAQKMGVTGAELEAIRTGAVLHDIGKLGVPDYVLLKPGRLSPEEFAKMKRHPVVGAEILAPVEFPWPVADVVRHHHERWDGKGYPDGLAGEAIPLSARILSVADVYDALTSQRPYRPAWPHPKTVEYLHAEAGTQFDASVVRAFLEVVDEANCTMQNLDATLENVGAVVGQVSTLGSTASSSRQIGRSASELWVFYEVSQALNSPAPMQQRLALLSQKLTAIMQGATCAFLLYDMPDAAGQRTLLSDSLQLWPDSLQHVASASGETREPRLRVYAAAGQNADLLYAHPLMDAASPSSQAARNRGLYRGPYMDEGLTWSMSEDAARPVRSILALPLVHGDESLGAMTFYHRDAEAFHADDAHMLSMIAEQVQAALYQEREYVRTCSDANTDALTGLHNMRYLRQKMVSLLPPPSENSFALLYLDLDNFKNVNTLYGHPQGSRVLREVAQLLPRELRPSDVAVRYGGDEFVIVLSRTGEAGAREVALRIRAAVQKYHPTFLPAFDASCRLDVSIGIACCPDDGSSVEELVAIADRRMYQAKTLQKLDLLAPLAQDEQNAIPPLLPTWSAPEPSPLCLDTAVVASVLQQVGLH